MKPSKRMVNKCTQKEEKRFSNEPKFYQIVNCTNFSAEIQS